MELKRLVDAGGDGSDLRNLVFTAISGEDSRKQLLSHFHAEATSFGERPTHVLADIDMTLWYGTFGTGGPKYPKGTVPGAMPLFAALGGRVAFLSARPPIWQSQTRGLLQNDIGIAEATVLPGSLGTIVRSLFQPDKASRVMAEQKAESFVQFAGLYPEARFVFIGDSGEGDVEFANVFMRGGGEDAEQDVTQRVALIHDITDSDGVRPKTTKIERASLQSRGIFVFDTYAGAAIMLYRLGFLDQDGLKIVAQGSVQEFSDICPENFASQAVFRARHSEFTRDMQEVNAALRENMHHAGDALPPVTDVEAVPGGCAVSAATSSEAMSPLQEPSVGDRGAAVRDAGAGSPAESLAATSVPEVSAVSEAADAKAKVAAEAEATPLADARALAEAAQAEAKARSPAEIADACESQKEIAITDDPDTDADADSEAKVYWSSRQGEAAVVMERQHERSILLGENHPAVSKHAGDLGGNDPAAAAAAAGTSQTV